MHKSKTIKIIKKGKNNDYVDRSLSVVSSQSASPVGIKSHKLIYPYVCYQGWVYVMLSIRSYNSVLICTIAILYFILLPTISE